MTRRTRSRAIGIVAALALIVAAPVGSGTADQGGSPAIVAAKSCSSGYKHAVLPNGHKCLRAGQYCKKSWDGRYHKYGFHCHNGRLKRK